MLTGYVKSAALEELEMHSVTGKCDICHAVGGTVHLVECPLYEPVAVLCDQCYAVCRGNIGGNDEQGRGL